MWVVKLLGVGELGGALGAELNEAYPYIHIFQNNKQTIFVNGNGSHELALKVI